MTNETMMREAPVWKLLLKMSVPMVVIMLANVIYNMADVFFLGQTGDAVQVAAVSLAGPVFSILAGLGSLLGSGAVTAIAIALGKGDGKQVKKYSSFCFWSSLAVGIAAGAAVLLCMDPLLGLLGARGETAPYTADYLRIMALGAPLMVVVSVMGNVVRADGSAVSSMVVCLVGNAVNVVLDPLFILALGWGVPGAALATVAGNLVACVCLYVLIRKRKVFTLSPKYFSLRPQISLRVLSLGLPMAAGIVLQSFSGMFGNRLLVQYGTAAVAANGISSKAGSLLHMVIMGICMGIQPAISYVFGRGDRKRLRQILWGTGLVSATLSTAMAAGFYFGRAGFMAAFLDDPAVVELGTLMILGMAVSAPLSGLYQLCTAYLQGTGKVSFATLTALLQKGLVYVPVLYLMERALGFSGIAFTGAVTDLLSTAAAGAMCLCWAGKLRRTMAAPAGAAA